MISWNLTENLELLTLVRELGTPTKCDSHQFLEMALKI
jgi:hypothetical protein